MITTQKAFNKSLVDENTQIIFLDEAHANLMDPDDWKILTQGGLTAHDRNKSHSLKQRQLNLLAAGVKRAVEDINNQDQRARKRALEETRQRWISLVMMREGDVPLLQSVSNAYHSNIEEGKNTLQRKKNNNNGC
ncbi:unnamed protein product [Porites evermanni]|uniref:Uncharacterized protein n=1 Tax=Porites evermanni TaxID=104178 RepID=A0ABN8SFP0_9CNID|nr:unnamed protein product [Porites evermanni]